MNVELDLMTVLGILVTAVVVLGKFILDKMMMEIDKVSELENKLNLLQQKCEYLELATKRTEIRNARHITEIAGQLRDLIMNITMGSRNNRGTGNDTNNINYTQND
jgi:hypothetical protein